MNIVLLISSLILAIFMKLEFAISRKKNNLKKVASIKIGINRAIFINKCVFGDFLNSFQFFICWFPMYLSSILEDAQESLDQTIAMNNKNLEANRKQEVLATK